jgi:hypothetical protein
MGYVRLDESAIGASSFALKEILAIRRKRSVMVHYISNQADADQPQNKPMAEHLNKRR